MKALFSNRLFVAVFSGHFVLDTLNGVGPVLLAVLSGPLALTNAQIGLALTLYTFAGSLSQPLFGWLADRTHGRAPMLAGLGLAWTALCYVAVALAHRWELLLPFFLLAALGSGLFHPIGASSATQISRERAGSSSSVFFFGGQAGISLGPILGGLLFGRAGAVGVLPICALMLLPVGLLLTSRAAPAPVAAPRAAGTSTRRAVSWAAVAFVVLVAVRSSIQASYTAFLPKLFADRGWEPTAYGALAGTFLFGAAIGNVLTGEMADRYGMRAATVWPLLLGVPAGLICLWTPSVPAAFVACGLAGLLIGGQHSVLVVHAQRLLPAQQGFAAGLILGFTFAAGGIGTWIGGQFADQVGLVTVMQAMTLLSVPAAALALTLPGRARLRAQEAT